MKRDGKNKIKINPEKILGIMIILKIINTKIDTEIGLNNQETAILDPKAIINNSIKIKEKIEYFVFFKFFFLFILHMNLILFIIFLFNSTFFSFVINKLLNNNLLLNRN
jgi:hypothetical protein